MGKKRVHADAIPASPTVKFSFKHLDLTHPKFSLNNCCPEFWQALFVCLKLFSGWTVEQFTDQYNQEHRHTIHFPETSEPGGFNVDPDNLGMEQCWQFAVNPECHATPDARWRVHGILAQDGTFYLIWLDPCHRLFPKAFSC
jgi:hypothetical protein